MSLHDVLLLLFESNRTNYNGNNRCKQRIVNKIVNQNALSFPKPSLNNLSRQISHDEFALFKMNKVTCTFLYQKKTEAIIFLVNSIILRWLNQCSDRCSSDSTVQECLNRACHYTCKRECSNYKGSVITIVSSQCLHSCPLWSLSSNYRNFQLPRTTNTNDDIFRLISFFSHRLSFSSLFFSNDRTFQSSVDGSQRPEGTSYATQPSCRSNDSRIVDIRNDFQ